MGLFGKVGEMFKGESDYENEEENNTVEETEEANTAEAKPVAPRSTNVGSSAALEMKVVKPERFDSAVGIGEHLLNRRTVVINFEDTNKETIRRILDFLGGVVFAIDGNIKKVSDATYIVTPKNVDVSADAAEQEEEPQNKELF